MISVIIPFFQRTEGILRKALTSVAAQQGCPVPVRVIVVDDGSPVPAGPEIAELTLPANTSVEILMRENGGPGAARNTALDAVSDSTYVAFLDSDDEWSSNHLVRAYYALEQGYDFYFANIYQLGQTVGAFERAGRIVSSQHPNLKGPHVDLHAYSGDMFEQINFGNVIGTSTVVYRFASYPAVRFLEQFRSAGEDYLFWMSLAVADAKFAFSGQVEAMYGRGVNVYSGVEWGTSAHLRRVHDEMMFKLYVLRSHKLTANQTRGIETHIERLREEFSSSLLSLLLHRRRPPLGLLTYHLTHAPFGLARFPSMLLRRMLPGHT